MVKMDFAFRCFELRLLPFLPKVRDGRNNYYMILYGSEDREMFRCLAEAWSIFKLFETHVVAKYLKSRGPILRTINEDVTTTINFLYNHD